MLVILFLAATQFTTASYIGWNAGLENCLDGSYTQNCHRVTQEDRDEYKEKIITQYERVTYEEAR